MNVERPLIDCRAAGLHGFDGVLDDDRRHLDLRHVAISVWIVQQGDDARPHLPVTVFGEFAGRIAKALILDLVSLAHGRRRQPQQAAHLLAARAQRVDASVHRHLGICKVLQHDIDLFVRDPA